ncbi:MAG: hypothetical protein GXY50_02435 [Syntrophomonadaceae bacterium]|nr:hypothetical protein [Syntrophomonadaceae bacterium]
MKTRRDLIGDLRRTMGGFVGQTFTEEMLQRIRIDAVEIMNTAYDEGQGAMAPFLCANLGTDPCPQREDCIASEEYDEAVCRECNLNGGFSMS